MELFKLDFFYPFHHDIQNNHLRLGIRTVQILLKKTKKLAPQKPKGQGIWLLCCKKKKQHAPVLKERSWVCGILLPPPPQKKKKKKKKKKKTCTKINQRPLVGAILVKKQKKKRAPE